MVASVVPAIIAKHTDWLEPICKHQPDDEAADGMANNSKNPAAPIDHWLGTTGIDSAMAQKRVPRINRLSPIHFPCWSRSPTRAQGVESPNANSSMPNNMCTGVASKPAAKGALNQRPGSGTNVAKT